MLPNDVSVAERPSATTSLMLMLSLLREEDIIKVCTTANMLSSMPEPVIWQARANVLLSI